MTTQRKVTKDFYIANPNRDIPHAEAVDAIERAYREQTGKKFRDPDRAIRTLHQEGLLQKVSKGVYRYSPEAATSIEQEDFTPKQKAEILRRGDFKCAVCGKSEKDGVELQVDHIRPKADGGRAIISNGQVLCAAHNFKKNTYSQTETGKRMFIGLLKSAEEEGDEDLIRFITEVLMVYEKHDMNGHIVWKPKES